MLHHAEEIFDILTHETVESKLKNRDTGMYIIIYVLDVRAESMRFDCDWAIMLRLNSTKEMNKGRMADA